MRVRVWGAALAAAVVAGCAACGGGDGGSRVASAGGSGTASVPASLSPEDARLRFAQCMRENGVNVPDPKPGDDRMRLGRGLGGGEKLQDALEKCERWLQEGGQLPDLKDPKVRDQYVEFAQCMRENGVNIPDPGPDGQIRLPTERVDRTKVQKAREACRELVPGAGK